MTRRDHETWLISDMAAAGYVHVPRRQRPHIAEEFRERLEPAVAAQLTRGLRPWAALRARGEVVVACR